MRKAGLIILSFIIAFSIFNSNEIYKKDIRNRLIIQGIGIDLSGDDFIVTLQAIDTSAENISSSDNASQPPVRTYSLSGDTIYTAIKSVTEIEGKIPLYSQNRVIILGKSVTEQNMSDVIDFFVRDVENSASVCVAAAEKTAGEILKEKNVSAEAIESSISSVEFDGKVFMLQLYDLINRYNSGTKDFAMPLLSLVEEDGEKTVEISGTALFNDTCYRQVISREETLFLNILYNRLNNTALSYSLNGENRVSLNIVDSKTERTVTMDKGTPKFTVKITLQCDITEISGGVSSLMTHGEIEKLRKAGERFICDETEKLLYSLYNEHNSDAAGLARLLYICHQDFYRENEKNLDSVLQNSIYEVEVNLKIRRTGHEFIT